MYKTYMLVCIFLISSNVVGMDKKSHQKLSIFKKIEDMGWNMMVRPNRECLQSQLDANLPTLHLGKDRYRDPFIYWVGRAYYHHGEFDLAQSWWNKLSNKHLYESSINFFLGILNYNENKLEEAKTNLKKVKIKNFQKPLKIPLTTKSKDMKILTKELLDRIKNKEKKS